MVEMKDISKKEIVEREAIASGTIYLKRETIKTIKEKKVEKGDVMTVAEIAGINAAKQTQTLIPLCHQIKIERVKFNFEVNEDNIKVICKVKTTGKTGIEMEALVGVSIALNTIWDMVKYLEKDANGQYPTTKITDIKVIKKIKENE